MNLEKLKDFHREKQKQTGIVMHDLFGAPAELTADAAIKFHNWMSEDASNIEANKMSDEEAFEYFINNIYKAEE